MITLVASTRRATAVSDDAITTRSVGIPVTLDLSEHFDGLAVTLVCKAGEVSRDIAVLDPDALEVPVDCLQFAGVPLLLGLVGKNAAGTIVIRTTMASAGTIRVGTEESDVDPSDPVPDWTVQVQQWAEDAHDTAERLAAEVDGWETAIDAAVDGAENVNATVSKSGDTATISVTDREGVTHTATVSDGADGRPGADGQPGADGYSPTAIVTQTSTGATISITDKSGTTTASVSNGTDGTDGTDGADGFSPTVSVEEITGGHEVTITDADGAHSFEVMDGDPATPGSITDEMLAPDGIKPQVAQLWGNQLTGSMGGTIASVDDAYTAPPMALSVEGASTQAGYTGKNLFDKDGQKGYWSDTDGSFVSSSLRVWWSAPVSEGDVIRTSSAGVWSSQTYLNGEFVTGGISASSSSGYVIPAGVDEIRGSIANNGWDTGIVTKNNADLTYEPYTGGKPTPRPDYPQPILSVDDLSLVMAGKNLLNTSSYGTQTLNGLTFTRNADGAIVVNGTATANTVVYPLAGNITIIEGTYTLSGCPAGGSSTTYELNLGGNLIRDYGSGGTRTISANTTTQLRIVVKSGVTCNNLTFYPQLEVGSTATQYTPYVTLTTAPDLLPEGTDLRSLPDGTRDTLNLSYLRPSTRAGWAWYSREVVQRVTPADMGDLTWVNYYGNRIFYAGVSGMTNGTTDSLQAMCEIFTPYKTATLAWFGNYAPANSIALMAGIASIGVMLTPETAYESAAAFKAAMSGIYAYVPLATPTTTTLDPIELPTLPAPTATVWCDGGSATPTYTMEYVKDANLVVQQLAAETSIAYASIAAQDGPTATASHAIGTYLTMGGTLYKVTRAIAVGETIAAGTNVTATTVMAELLARTA